MNEQHISWLISLDKHIITLHSVALLLSTFMFFLDYRIQLPTILKGSQKTKRIFVLLLPFLLLPLTLALSEKISVYSSDLLWEYSSTKYGREIWFAGLMLMDVSIAYLIVKVHIITKVSLTFFSTLIYQAWLTKAFLHVLTYIQLNVFDEIALLSEFYRLGIPAINIGIGLVVIAQSLSLRRENVYYGNAI